MKKKGLKLILAGITAGLLLPLAACNIEFSTYDTVTSSDGSSQTATVIPGDEYDEVPAQEETETDETTETDDSEAVGPVKTETEETTDTAKEEATDTTTDSTLIASLNAINEDYTTLYGYTMLANETYGSYLQEVYASLYADAYDFLISDEDYDTYTSSGYEYVIISEFKFTSSSYVDLIASAWITMIEENPLFYFTYTGYKVNTYGHGSSKYYTFCFLAGGDYAEAIDRQECNEDIVEFTNEFVEYYTNSGVTSDYDKAKLVHDYICNRVSYAYDSDGQASMEFWAHNILGVVYKKGSVCESYAETYLFLSYQIDLESLIVLGYSSNVGHAWNYVCIDGTWYGLDATWDDADTTISYDYFLISSTIMNDGHTANTNSSYGIDYQVELPTLSTTSYDTSLDDAYAQSHTGSSSSSSHSRPSFPGRR